MKDKRGGGGREGGLKEEGLNKCIAPKRGGAYLRGGVNRGFTLFDIASRRITIHQERMIYFVYILTN